MLLLVAPAPMVLVGSPSVWPANWFRNVPASVPLVATMLQLSVGLPSFDTTTSCVVLVPAGMDFVIEPMSVASTGSEARIASGMCVVGIAPLVGVSVTSP